MSVTFLILAFLLLMTTLIIICTLKIINHGKIYTLFFTTKNCEMSIEYLVRSLMNLCEKNNLNLIVMDNNSSDDTPKILESLSSLYDFEYVKDEFQCLNEEKAVDIYVEEVDSFREANKVLIKAKHDIYCRKY